jgi:hypothetical protein
MSYRHKIMGTTLLDSYNRRVIRTLYRNSTFKESRADRKLNLLQFWKRNWLQMAVARLYTRFVCNRSKNKQLVLAERAAIVAWRSKYLIKMQHLVCVCGMLHDLWPIDSVSMSIPVQLCKLHGQGQLSPLTQLQWCPHPQGMNHRHYNVLLFCFIYVLTLLVLCFIYVITLC